jgi:putative oxidoreductase
MRRLFSTFAPGAPGIGLLLMRAAAGGALLFRAVPVLAAGPPVAVAVFDVLAAGIGILLLVGLWTPVVGALAAVVAAWCAFSNPGGVGFYILLGTLGVALALLGPGAWSVDARLFGWKRVEIRNGNGNRKRQDPPPF